MRIQKGDGVNPWDTWQICPCCAAVLNEWGVIDYDRYHSVSTRCLNSIKDELTEETIPIGAIRQVQENRNKRRKEYIARMRLS